MNSFQRPLFVGFISITSIISMAQAQDKHYSGHPTPYYKTGFYGGAALGYATDKLHDTFYYDNIASGGTQQSITLNPTSHSVTGDLVIGGRILLNNGFMPGFDVTVSTIRSKWDIDFPFRDFTSLGDPALHVKVEKSYTVTPALVLGAVLKEKYYLFTKLGVSIDRVKTTITDPQAGGGKNSQSEFLLGFSANVGLEYAFNDQWSIMGMVGYEITRDSEYESRSYQPVINGLSRVGRDIASHKIHTQTYTQKIGVIYKF